VSAFSLSLFLVLLTHSSSLSSLQLTILQRQASKPFAFPISLSSLPSDVDCPTHTRTHLPPQQTTHSTLKAGLCPQSLVYQTCNKTIFRQETGKPTTIPSHGARKCLQEARTSSRWTNPQRMADSTSLRTAQTWVVENQGTREPEILMLPQRCAAVLAARPRVRPLPVTRGEVLGSGVPAPQTQRCPLRVLRSARPGVAILDVQERPSQADETGDLPKGHGAASRTQSKRHPEPPVHVSGRDQDARRP
jgi:hypothetical protein